MRFAQRIRALRHEKHLSQRAVAASVGIDFTYLSKIELGALAPPSKAVITRLATVLGADENELINLAGKVPKDLKAVLYDNPHAVALLHVLRTKRLPAVTYRDLIAIARKAQAE